MNLRYSNVFCYYFCLAEEVRVHEATKSTLWILIRRNDRSPKEHSVSNVNFVSLGCCFI